MATEAELKCQIDKQNSLIEQRLEQNVRQISEFYWGNDAPKQWGASAPPWSGGKSLIPQLLSTPILIVDLIPITSSKFPKYYGMHLYQFRELVEDGFIIPNFYEFKNGNWKKYANF